MKGEVSTRAAGYLRTGGADQVADTLALCAISDLVVILDVREKAVPRESCGVRPCGRSR